MGVDVADLIDAFGRRFGRPPAGVWRAPGRVNLVGDHTDHSGGRALPFAIDRHVVVAAAPRTDGRVVACSAGLGTDTRTLADAPPRGAAGWADHVAGPLWSLAREGVAVGGLDVCVASDLPAASGLSSSAALECAVLIAARDLFGGPEDVTALALVARRAENDWVGVPCGVMDQIASLGGRAGRALLVDARAVRFTPVPLDVAAEGLALVVVDTRTPRTLAAGGYALRREEFARAAALLGANPLAGADPAEVAAARGRLGDTLYRRARHVVEEDARVGRAAAVLGAGTVAAIGPLLDASHASLRDDAEVTTPALDTAVAAARGAGALGARMTGGGFGGCAVVLLPEDRIAEVGATCRDAAARAGLPRPDVFRVTPAAGAARIA